MGERRRIETERLVLRGFVLADAPAVQRIAGDREVAAGTLRVPHPYEDGVAEEWIQSLEEKYVRGELVTFAITRRGAGELIGSMGLEMKAEHRRAELGYLIGKASWGRGYCTEAARAVVKYGFEALGLARITAYHFSWNQASGRVLQKVGMRHEGCLRKHICKWDVMTDVEMYGILQEECLA